MVEKIDFDSLNNRSYDEVHHIVIKKINTVIGFINSKMGAPSDEDRKKLKELHEESKDKYNHPKFDWILHKLMREWGME